MDRYLNSETVKPVSVNENFDCNKMKSLLTDDSKHSFGERFSKWVNQYTKDAREKIWMDIEYFRSR
jgi:hypothetical protein